MSKSKLASVLVSSLAVLILVPVLSSCSAGGVVSTGAAGQTGSAGSADAGTAGVTGLAGDSSGGGSTGAGGTSPTTGAAGSATGAAGRTMTGTAGASPDGGAPIDAGTFYDVPPPPMASRGATVPWLEYEAEAASTNGAQVGPDRTFGTIASEASGRRAVRLEQMGQFVEFTSTARANAIVVRYVIPDAPTGGGMTATLDLSIGGAPATPLTLTSKYAWSYGGEASTANDPSMGGAHHFYDEVHALVGDIAPGTKVRLQKDAANMAAYYVIDLVDLEYVGPPLPQPANTLSLQTDCGGKPDDGVDDGKALANCAGAAKNMGKGVWIPPGNWDMTAAMGDLEGVEVNDVTVSGAGMWYSTLRGPWSRFHCIGNNCRFQNFAMMGETVLRDDTAVDNAFNGGAGTGSRLDNIWVEHTKVGFWVGEGAKNVTSGLVVAGCRFRDLAADGVNFNDGTSNSELVNSHFRNTGDDAAASWSQAAFAVNTSNMIHFNTVQLPWRADCFGVYGGTNISVEDNLCFDAITYPGVLVAQEFTSHDFGGTISIQRNSIVRAGGHMYNEDHGAIELLASLGSVSNVLIKDDEIDDPTYAGLHIEGPNPVSATFDTITITTPGSYGILVKAMSKGAGMFSNVTVSGPGAGGLSYEPSASFTINKGAGDTGW
jgi:hypothetical protein